MADPSIEEQQFPMDDLTIGQVLELSHEFLLAEASVDPGVRPGIIWHNGGGGPDAHVVVDPRMQGILEESGIHFLTEEEDEARRAEEAARAMGF